MLKFLQRPSTIAVLTLAGVLIPLVVWQVDKRTRAISIEREFSLPFASNMGQEVPDLRVLIGQEEVKEAYVSTFRVQNSGSDDIPRSDFDAPISLSVSEPARIVRSEVIAATGGKRSASVSHDGRSVVLAPRLFNAGDYVLFSVLTAEKIPEFSLEGGRIKGVSRIEYLSERGAALFDLSFFTHIFAAICLITLYIVGGMAFVYRVVPSNKSSTLGVWFRGLPVATPLIAAVTLGCAFSFFTLITEVTRRVGFYYDAPLLLSMTPFVFAAVAGFVVAFVSVKWFFRAALAAKNLGAPLTSTPAQISADKDK